MYAILRILHASYIRSSAGFGVRMLPMAEAVQLVRILGGAAAIRHQRGEAVLRAATVH
jgi:hypothetical protein